MQKRTHQEIQAAEQYWKEATAFVRKISDDPKNPSWFDLTREMPTRLEAWENYFTRRLGFIPAGLEMLKASKISVFLVPQEWPEWFDTKAARAA